MEDGTSAYFAGLNRNKRNICLDARSNGGAEILSRLIANCDVLIENFKAGTLASWGLGYEDTLRDRFPRLIYCRITGFGVDGPYAHRPAYAPTIGAGSGMCRRNIGDAVPEIPELTLDQIKAGATKLFASGSTVGHPDGFSGICVATGLFMTAPPQK